PPDTTRMLLFSLLLLLPQPRPTLFPYTTLFRSSARSDIADINKELRKLRFSTKYQFDVKMLGDSSDYAKILRYAEYLQESNDMGDRKSTRLNSSHVSISYAVFCLKKKKTQSEIK